MGLKDGIESGLDFWGGSFVSDPMGYVIAEANDNEQILYAECDFAKVKRTRELWGFIQARRPEEYKPLREL